MEFYDLPCDIKRIIFNINREDSLKEKVKEKHLTVLQNIEDLNFVLNYYDLELIKDLSVKDTVGYVNMMT